MQLAVAERNSYLGPKSGLVVSVLDSWLEDRGFEYYPMLDENGAKAMPGSITASNPGSLMMKNIEKKVSQMGHMKIFFK